MTPIHELLNRIRWDREFSRGDFVIGYLDRVEDRIIKVPLRELFFEPGDHFSFDLIDAAGQRHSIPLHRIKAVYRDNTLIWRREH